MFRRIKMNTEEMNIFCPYVKEEELPELAQYGPFYFYKKIPDDVALLEILDGNIQVKFLISENWNIEFEKKIKESIEKNKIEPGTYLYNIVDHTFIYSYASKKILDKQSTSLHPFRSDKGGPKNTCLVFDREGNPFRIFKHGNLDSILYASVVANEYLCVKGITERFGTSVAIDLIIKNEFLPETPIENLDKHIERNSDFFFMVKADVPSLPIKLFTNLDTLLATKEDEEPKKISLLELVDKKFIVDGEFIVTIDMSGFPFKNNPYLSMKYKDKKLEIVSPGKTATNQIFNFMEKNLGFKNFSITERTY